MQQMMIYLRPHVFVFPSGAKTPKLEQARRVGNRECLRRTGHSGGRNMVGLNMELALLFCPIYLLHCTSRRKLAVPDGISSMRKCDRIHCTKDGQCVSYHRVLAASQHPNHDARHGTAVPQEVFLDTPDCKHTSHVAPGSDEFDAQVRTFLDDLVAVVGILRWRCIRIPFDLGRDELGAPSV